MTSFIQGGDFEGPEQQLHVHDVAATLGSDPDPLGNWEYLTRTFDHGGDLDDKQPLGMAETATATYNDALNGISNVIKDDFMPMETSKKHNVLEPNDCFNNGSTSVHNANGNSATTNCALTRLLSALYNDTSILDMEPLPLGNSFYTTDCPSVPLSQPQQPALQPLPQLTLQPQPAQPQMQPQPSLPPLQQFESPFPVPFTMMNNAWMEANNSMHCKDSTITTTIPSAYTFFGQNRSVANDDSDRADKLSFAWPNTFDVPKPTQSDASSCITLKNSVPLSFVRSAPVSPPLPLPPPPAVPTAPPLGCKVKMCLPLTAYNYFYRNERDHIVEGMRYAGDPIPEQIYDFSQAKMEELLHQHWYVDPYKEKRPHRTTHGRIDFRTLSRVIATRWKHLPATGRAFYRRVAQADQDKYDHFIPPEERQSKSLSAQRSASVGSSSANSTCTEGSDNSKMSDTSSPLPAELLVPVPPPLFQ